MGTVLGLREFIHMRWDPRIVLVDARQSSTAPARPLDNPFFAWVRVTTRAQADRIASDISQRHLIVIHEDEERALELDGTFKALEITSAALEGGERGWSDAIIQEDTEVRGEALVVTLNQLACNRRQYLIVRGSHAIALQPSGSIDAICEGARHQGARIEAVIDVAGNAAAAACLADAVSARYLSADALEIGGPPLEICGIRLRRTGTNSLELANRQLIDNTYRTH